MQKIFILIFNRNGWLGIKKQLPTYLHKNKQKWCIAVWGESVRHFCVLGGDFLKTDLQRHIRRAEKTLVILICIRYGGGVKHKFFGILVCVEDGAKLIQSDEWCSMQSLLHQEELLIWILLLYRKVIGKKKMKEKTRVVVDCVWRRRAKLSWKCTPSWRRGLLGTSSIIFSHSIACKV